MEKGVRAGSWVPSCPAHPGCLQSPRGAHKINVDNLPPQRSHTHLCCLERGKSFRVPAWRGDTALASCRDWQVAVLSAQGEAVLSPTMPAGAGQTPLAHPLLHKTSSHVQGFLFPLPHRPFLQAGAGFLRAQVLPPPTWWNSKAYTCTIQASETFLRSSEARSEGRTGRAKSPPGDFLGKPFFSCDLLPLLATMTLGVCPRVPPSHHPLHYL